MDFKIDSTKLAPSGISGDLFFVNQGVSDQSDKARFEDNTQRKFILKGLFSKNNIDIQRIHGSINPIDGSSFLLTPKDATSIKLDMDGELITFELNSQNELSCVVYECNATSISEAKTEFYNKAHVFIDYLSYLEDLPIRLVLLDCKDVINDIYVINYVSPYINKNLSLRNLSSRKELKEVYSLYREAKNAESPYYRFLCYFKILEGIYKHLRGAINRKAKERGVILKHIDEIVPNNAEFPLEYGKFVGWNIRRFFNDILRHEYRDACAHFVLDGSPILRITDYEQYSKFINIIYITECCCRIAISTQEAYYEQFDEAVNKKT